MKWFILLCAVGLMAAAWQYSTDAPIAADRAAEQRALLAELDRIGTEPARTLADEWRTTYPRPTDQNLTELRLLVERVKADPASAVSYTAAEKRRKQDASPFEPALGWSDPKPGLR